jgi:predicted small lipoprotein YifL
MTRIAITTLLALSLVSALAGCGDNASRAAGPGSGPPADGSPPPPGDSTPDPALARAVVVAGDFNPGHPGVLSTYNTRSGAVVANAGPAMAVGDDPVLRHVGHELFIVNRNDGNNVTILDDRSLAFEEQLGTGPSSNPQDVAVVGDKLYVPTYGSAGVTVLTRGSTTTSVIDLSVDDPDGKPNCESIYLVGSDLYVACQLLDDTQTFLPPRGPGKVYVVDTATDRVRATLTLGHDNPFSLLEQVPAGAAHGGELVVGTVLFDDGSGCVERIVPGATPQAAGCLVDNADLGGYASRIAFEADPGAAIGFFAVPMAFPHADLRALDMPTGMLRPAALNLGTEIVGDVVVCPDGSIVVADPTMNANGLRVFQGSTEKTTAALPIGLPPTSTHGLVCY